MRPAITQDVVKSVSVCVCLCVCVCAHVCICTPPHAFAVYVHIVQHVHFL